MSAVVQVVYHQEDGVWWAESPDLDGYGASAETLQELRPLVQEGVAFFTESSDVLLDERFPYVVLLATQIDDDSPANLYRISTTTGARVHHRLVDGSAAA